jgi:hypothetical protein
MMSKVLMLLAALGLVLLSSASCARVVDERPMIRDDWKPPAFCHGYDCPKFKILKTDNERELRKYEPGAPCHLTSTTSLSDSGGQSGSRPVAVGPCTTVVLCCAASVPSGACRWGHQCQCQELGSVGSHYRLAESACPTVNLNATRPLDVVATVAVQPDGDWCISRLQNLTVAVWV